MRFETVDPLPEVDLIQFEANRVHMCRQCIRSDDKARLLGACREKRSKCILKDALAGWSNEGTLV